MELANEDNLRLNVLLRQDLKAVRIDESRMVVHALTPKGEARVPLNATCREEKYLRMVRELLSTHVLGSPGGYPVYIRRWTRMGQARDESSLERLLLIGEPEAVTAVVHAPELTPEIATHAWWAYPTSENARQLLNTPAVAKSSLGPELAAFLVEFLPFEEEAQAMIDSVRLVLQPSLISDQQRLALWKKSKRKHSYYIGFLHTLPDDLPDQRSGHPQQSAYLATQQQIPDNPYIRCLLRSFSPSGQVFLRTAAQVIHKAPNQDAVVELMEAIGAYFHDIRPDEQRYRLLDEIDQRVETRLGNQEVDVAQQEILGLHPELEPLLRSMMTLSMLSEFVVAPIFGHSNAIGTVMRRRLEPVTQPVLTQLATLCPNLT